MDPSRYVDGYLLGAQNLYFNIRIIDFGPVCPLLPADAVERVVEDFIGRLLEGTFGDGELQLAHADPHSGWIPSEGTVERRSEERRVGKECQKKMCGKD